MHFSKPIKFIYTLLSSLKYTVEYKQSIVILVVFFNLMNPASRHVQYIVTLDYEHFFSLRVESRCFSVAFGLQLFQ